MFSNNAITRIIKRGKSVEEIKIRFDINIIR